jgi:hypothetical protein
VRYDKAASSLVQPYINGVALTLEDGPNGSWGSAAAGSLFWLGCRITANQGFFDGKLGHLALWSSVLAAGDIASLAGGANPLSIGTPNGYWPLVSDATEASGGTSLTLGGSPTFDAADNPTVASLSNDGVRQAQASQVEAAQVAAAQFAARSF